MFHSGLLNKIPKVKGELVSNASLSKSSWFKAGGPAEVLFVPKDIKDLRKFVKELDTNIPFLVLGASSNVLIRDGGIEGVVMKLGSSFSQINFKNNIIVAGGASMDMNIALFAAKNGIGGMEFLSGIPGSIGGSIKMNAGAYGREISDILQKIKIVKRDGSAVEMNSRELKMVYRKSFIPKNSIIYEVELKGYPKDKKEIFRDIEILKNKRIKTQPIKNLTGGSTFKNPEGLKAWELIDKAGCRGITMGEAKISEIHPNFIINKGKAMSIDIEKLGLEIRKRVKNNCGIDLKWEILRIGNKRRNF